MNFANNLRILRKKAGLTQSQLAEELNVSTQAISKWECNDSYPEITLLPILARRFHVSIDSLFGLPEPLSETEIQHLLDQCMQLCQIERSEAAILLLRKAVEENPENYELKQNLANLYILISEDAAAEVRNELLKQAAILLERITLECTHSRTVMQAEHSLFSVYYQLKWHTKLRELIQTRTYMETEVLSTPLLTAAKGNDRIFIAQSTLNEFCGTILSAINALTDEYTPGNDMVHVKSPGETQWQLSPAEIQNLLETGILIFDRIYGDDYSGLVLYTVWNMAIKLCRSCLKASNEKQALKALNLAVSYACRSDSNSNFHEAGAEFLALTRSVSHTKADSDLSKIKALELLPPTLRDLILKPLSSSPALRFLNAFNYGVPFTYKDAWLCRQTIQALSDASFDPIRETPDFAELTRKLETRISEE